MTENHRGVEGPCHEREFEVRTLRVDFRWISRTFSLLKAGFRLMGSTLRTGGRSLGAIIVQALRAGEPCAGVSRARTHIGARASCFATRAYAVRVRECAIRVCASFPGAGLHTWRS